MSHSQFDLLTVLYYKVRKESFGHIAVTCFCVWGGRGGREGGSFCRHYIFVKLCQSFSLIDCFQLPAGTICKGKYQRLNLELTFPMKITLAVYTMIIDKVMQQSAMGICPSKFKKCLFLLLLKERQEKKNKVKVVTVFVNSRDDV